MIRPVLAAELPEALRLAFQDFDAVDQEARVVAALSQHETNPHLFDGMLVATTDEGTLEGLIWIVEMPGKTCVTGLPCVRDPDNWELILGLLQAANAWLKASTCSLNQFVLSPDQHRAWGQILHHVEHPISIWLDHLTLSTRRAGTSKAIRDPGPQPLATAPVGDPQSASFLKLLSLTFLNSQDCSAISGHQDYADMVRGYLATGDSGAKWWRVFRQDGETVGCCLLSEHRSSSQLEVVYIGMIPAARGKGLARLALQEALQIARSIGMTSLIAVVDQDNQPARRMYRSLGFTRTETRVSRIRLLAGNQPTNL